jgi:hypothetical protein
MKYKIWDKKENLITPIGEVLSPEKVFEKMPAALHLKYIICDAPINMGVFMEFTATKEHYANLGVPFAVGLTDQEILDAISQWEYEQANKPPEPTAEERIAAAMEYDNMMKY